jgi:hypothetical protein
MRKLISTLSFAAVVLLSQSAFAQVAKIDSAAKMLPPGKYTCQMGSYKARDCEIVSKGRGVELVITPGQGHFIEFRAELLPSDDKGQMTLLGNLTSGQGVCDVCSPGAADSEDCRGGYEVNQQCLAQPIVARLKVSGGSAKGTVMYYINRPSYEGGNYSGYFKLGNTIDLVIKKK